MQQDDRGTSLAHKAAVTSDKISSDGPTKISPALLARLSIFLILSSILTLVLPLAFPTATMPPLKKRKLSHDESAESDRAGSPTDHEAADVGDDVQPTSKPSTFKELGVIDSLCETCEFLGYKAPTPIQAESIPLALQGRDLIGLAETGSGKTAAFVLPILQALMDKPQQLHSLILAPTRELAYQISQAVEALGSLIAVRCAVLVGGMDMIPQAIALGKKPHVIVATPGRLLDHLENTKGFSLRQLKYLIMDEADRLLDLDFGPILDKILKILPREGRKTYLFSATMSSKVESLQRASLSNPLRVAVSQDKFQTVSTLIQSYLFVPHKYKDLYLIHLLNEYAWPDRYHLHTDGQRGAEDIYSLAEIGLLSNTHPWPIISTSSIGRTEQIPRKIPQSVSCF